MNEMFEHPRTTAQIACDTHRVWRSNKSKAHKHYRMLKRILAGTNAKASRTNKPITWSSANDFVALILAMNDNLKFAALTTHKKK